jgi:hypothetical protein
MRVVSLSEKCNHKALNCANKTNPSSQRHWCRILSQRYGLQYVKGRKAGATNEEETCPYDPPVVTTSGVTHWLANNMTN